VRESDLFLDPRFFRPLPQRPANALNTLPLSLRAGADDVIE
jgi:hypothetical protein